MDIERIDEDTVKFFITVTDLENRGFSLDELWRNRHVGEQLFWEMLEEVQDEIDIEFEGPLFIQVNASEAGLEVLITQSHFDAEPQPLMNVDFDEKDASPIGAFANTMRRYHQAMRARENEQIEQIDPPLDEPQTFVFEHFDALIDLFKNRTMDFEGQRIFSYHERYYLVEDFSQLEMAELDIENVHSVIKEYGNDSKISVHVLEEYGKLIIGNHAFSILNQYFS